MTANLLQFFVIEL